VHEDGCTVTDVGDGVQRGCANRFRVIAPRSPLAAPPFGAASLLCAPAAQAQTVADFYKGKSVTLVVSSSPGGGYDIMSRTIAKYLGSHLPGNPRVLVQNMPGAGGIRAMIYLQNVAPKDGSTLGLVHSSVPYAPLYGIRGANFDPRQMNWIGSINSATGICVSWTASVVTKWQDLFDKNYVVGGTGAGSQMETMPAMINRMFGTKIKIVSGYKGGNDVYLAMERGEVHGRCGGLKASIKSTRPDWFPQKKVSVPVQIALERDPEFRDSPALVEFAKDEKTKQILQLVLSPMDMDRPILAPPGTPPAIVAALRTAFHAAMYDPGLVADAAKAHIDLDEVDGDKLARILARAYAMPPEIIKAANESMNLIGTGNE
jgi:tripartite-type tricarboxylate transporter receptor subunit TctC